MSWALLFRRWKDISISKKLYSVVGAMAFLIALELFTLIFVLNTLSAVRAFVGGEGLWSKAQKDAVYALRRYAITHSAEEYQRFKEFLRVPLGDHKARVELEKQKPDLSIAYQGFIEGKIHPDDIPGVTRFFLRFQNEPHVARSIKVWREGDRLLEQLQLKADTLKKVIDSGRPSFTAVSEIILSADQINDRLTKLEDEFSYTLGEGSRWLDQVVTGLAVFCVLTVELTGLILLHSLSRNISNGLNEMSALTQRVKNGDFSGRLPVRSKDEIGQLALNINSMVEELSDNIRNRIRAEQALAASEHELITAVQLREDFISTASHEIRTPISALKLQLDLTKRSIDRSKTDTVPTTTLGNVVSTSQKHVERLIQLVETLLDFSHLRSGKLTLSFEPTNLSNLVKGVIERLAAQMALAKCELQTEIDLDIEGVIDPLRFEQVMINLISNAVKYAPGTPLKIQLSASEESIFLTVKDKGPGIREEDLPKIFELYQRGTDAKKTKGLGLGLYLTQKIVEAHQGRIFVTSAPGNGTTFAVTLPKKAEAKSTVSV